MKALSTVVKGLPSRVVCIHCCVIERRSRPSIYHQGCKYIKIFCENCL